MAKHGAQGHDSGATTDKQERAVELRLPNEIAADRSAQLQFVSGPEFVDEVRRDLTVFEALYGQDQIGVFGSGRDRIAALGLIAIFGGETDVDVAVGGVTGPCYAGPPRGAASGGRRRPA